MQEYVLELSVGDTLVVGERTFTVIDIDGDDVTFRIDEADAEDSRAAASHEGRRRRK